MQKAPKLNLLDHFYDHLEEQDWLTGVDLSSESSLAARRNGYDFTATTELSKLPFPNDSFDYVVSLDVLGHIGFDANRGRPDLRHYFVQLAARAAGDDDSRPKAGQADCRTPANSAAGAASPQSVSTQSVSK